MTERAMSIPPRIDTMPGSSGRLELFLPQRLGAGKGWGALGVQGHSLCYLAALADLDGAIF